MHVWHGRKHDCWHQGSDRMTPLNEYVPEALVKKKCGSKIA